MKKISSFPAAARFLMVITLTFSPFAQAAENTEDFVKNASIGNEFEIESSKLAVERSKNDDIRQFAQEMIDDHMDIGKDMKSVLEKTQVNSSLADKTLDTQHQKIIDKLRSASDEEFDAEYIKYQKKAHEDTLKLFKSYSKSGDDSSLKDFATQTLPTLRKHEEHVKQLKAS